jgi:hypothetical protein
LTGILHSGEAQQVTREPFERALERCAADPQFESRLRSVYQGRHDVLDALWWAAHPLTPSPRGTLDPAAELRALQNAVFSRGRGESPIIEVTDPDTGASARMREDEHRLHEAQKLLAADAAQLSAALDAVEPTDAAAGGRESPDLPDSPRVGQVERELRVIPSAAVLVPSSIEHDQPAGEEHGFIAAPGGAAARARRLVLPVVSGVAVLAAIVFLPSLTGMNGGMGGTPTPAPAFSEAPRVRTEIVRLGSDGNVSDPLGILERPATDADRPPDSFPMHKPGSYRRLPDLVGHVQLYLARNREDAICLVVFRTDGASISGCTEESLFPAQGIWLPGDKRYSIGADATILTESFSLLANGDFHYEATARVRQPN